MKKINKLIGIALSLTMATLISGCGGGGDTSSTSVSGTKTGVLSLKMTDAPLKLDENVTEVNIAVIGIEYNHDGNWTAALDFEPKTFNLLDLQNGKTLDMGDMVLPAGHYTGLRFMLAAPQNDGDVKSNPDCNITFADGRSEPLFVPSGAQSGYKGIGEFDIIADAKIEVTADFDVHKSIVVAGNSDKYILKPVIRLVVTELSGMINGTVVDVADYNSSESLVVYTYEQDTYADTEAEGEIIFANSVSSGNVNMTDGNFTLSFLGEGSYSLVTARYIDNVFDTVVDIENDVVVFTGESTLVDVNTSDY